MYKEGDITLRRVQPSDLSFLMECENNPENWAISDRSEPVMTSEMALFIEEQATEVYMLDQIRFLILEQTTQLPIGTLDLYEVNWTKDSAFVGILIASRQKRRKNAAKQALICLEEFCKNWLELNLLKARIHVGNSASEQLFLTAGYSKNRTPPGASKINGAYLQYFTYEKWLKK